MLPAGCRAGGRGTWLVGLGRPRRQEYLSRQPHFAGRLVLELPAGERRSPAWAEALAGVDPVLCEPITTVPDGWPLAPAVWRRELRQRLMGELKPRPLGHLHADTPVPAPGRGRPRLTEHRGPPPDGQHPPDTTQ